MTNDKIEYNQYRLYSIPERVDFLIDLVNKYLPIFTESSSKTDNYDLITLREYLKKIYKREDSPNYDLWKKILPSNEPPKEFFNAPWVTEKIDRADCDDQTIFLLSWLAKKNLRPLIEILIIKDEKGNHHITQKLRYKNTDWVLVDFLPYKFPEKIEIVYRKKILFNGKKYLKNLAI